MRSAQYLFGSKPQIPTSMAAASSATNLQDRPFSRQALCVGGERKAAEFVFFYGISASAGDNAVFSNFFVLPEPMADEEGRPFQTSEHFMMHGKAILFGDHEMAQAILEATTALDAKKLGRKVRNFDDEIWRANSLRIVVDGLTLKFQQCRRARDVLLGTNAKILVEAAPRDRIWGIGMGRKNEMRLDPNTWRGQNLLGEALMIVRAKLQRN